MDMNEIRELAKRCVAKGYPMDVFRLIVTHRLRLNRTESVIKAAETIYENMLEEAD